MMTDLKFTSPSGETTIKFEETGRIGTVAPKTKLHIRKTPMTEIEKVKAEIKMLEKKLSFLEELEKTKSPVEEAYKDWWGEYPGDENWTSDATRWQGFQAGYNAAYEEKVVEQKDDYPYKKYTPEQTEQSLKEAFREAVKQGVVSSVEKPKTLTDILYRWWCDIFSIHSDWDMETSIEDLVDQIELFLPKEQSAAGSQNAYVECSVEGFNDAIKQIKSKLRNSSPH